MAARKRQEYAVLAHTFDQQQAVDEWCKEHKRPWFLRAWDNRSHLWHTEVTIRDDDYITLHNMVLSGMITKVTFGLFGSGD